MKPWRMSILEPFPPLPDVLPVHPTEHPSPHALPLSAARSPTHRETFHDDAQLALSDVGTEIDGDVAEEHYLARVRAYVIRLTMWLLLDWTIQLVTLVVWAQMLLAEFLPLRFGDTTHHRQAWWTWCLLLARLAAVVVSSYTLSGLFQLRWRLYTAAATTAGMPSPTSISTSSLLSQDSILSEAESIHSTSALLLATASAEAPLLTRRSSAHLTDAVPTSPEQPSTPLLQHTLHRTVHSSTSSLSYPTRMPSPTHLAPHLDLLLHTCHLSLQVIVLIWTLAKLDCVEKDEETGHRCRWIFFAWAILWLSFLSTLGTVSRSLARYRRAVMF